MLSVVLHESWCVLTSHGWRTWFSISNLVLFFPSILWMSSLTCHILRKIERNKIQEMGIFELLFVPFWIYVQDHPFFHRILMSIFLPPNPILNSTAWQNKCNTFWPDCPKCYSFLFLIFVTNISHSVQARYVQKAITVSSPYIGIVCFSELFVGFWVHTLNKPFVYSDNFSLHCCTKSLVVRVVVTASCCCHSCWEVWQWYVWFLGKRPNSK